MENRGKFKVIVMGGNLIGCKILRHLFRIKDVSIPLVISNWGDNGSVFQHHAWNASLTRVAISKSLQVVQPATVHSSDFMKIVKNVDRPDLIVTAESEHYLPDYLLTWPRLGVVNVHFSKLPRHRGAFPVIWSIMEDDEAGVTLHWVNEKINGGDIIAQKTIRINDDDTAISVYQNLVLEGIKLFAKFFPDIVNSSAPRIPQNEEEATFHRIGYPSQGIIDWTDSAERVRRLIHALHHPATRSATAFLESFDFPIYILPPARVIDSSSFPRYEPGTIAQINDNGIIVQTGEGLLLFEKFSYDAFYGRKKSAYLLAEALGLKEKISKFTIFKSINKEHNLNVIHSDYSKLILINNVKTELSAN